MVGVVVSRPSRERQGRTISPPPGRVSGTPALWYLGVAGVPPPLPYGVWKTSPHLFPVGSSPLLGSDIYISYTHLRAHETPEHLVCRLLLEKKKLVCRLLLEKKKI